MIPAVTPAATPPVTSAVRTGLAGLAATAVSIVCTVAVAAAGPSLLEPPLPGAASQPPWAFDLGLNPYLAVGLAAAGLAAGTLGVALTLRAIRRGWTVSPRYVLIAGALAAAVAGTTRPFGSSDFISYAAYGRELVTGHNPYLVAPVALARLGDPVARAVQDWAGTPSVYGALATGMFGIASLIGGTSVRLTVFVLDAASVAAFIGTGVLLDRIARGRPRACGRRCCGRAIRCCCRSWWLAAMWTGWPPLSASPGSRYSPLVSRTGGLVYRGTVHQLPPGRDRGAARFAASLAGATPRAGIRREANGAAGSCGTGDRSLAAEWFSLRRPARRPSASPARRGPTRDLIAVSGAIAPRIAIKSAAVLGLVAGFGAVAGADILLIGRAGVAQTLRASGMVSVGSPWRVVRTLLSLLVGSSAADDVVRWCAVALAVFLAMRLLRLLRPTGRPFGFVPDFRRYSGGNAEQIASAAVGWGAVALVFRVVAGVAVCAAVVRRAGLGAAAAAARVRP